MKLWDEAAPRRCHECHCELRADTPLGQNFCTKHADAGEKIASLKTLAEGSDVPVVFKDSAAKQPPRRRRK